MEQEWNETKQVKNEVFEGKKTFPLPLYPPQLPHGLACGEYSPPSASRGGGPCCVLLHQLLEELQYIHMHNLPEERASIYITYRRNLPPSASPTGGTCLHLHHLPEELASICITYRRNLPPSA